MTFSEYREAVNLFEADRKKQAETGKYEARTLASLRLAFALDEAYKMLRSVSLLWASRSTREQSDLEEELATVLPKDWPTT